MNEVNSHGVYTGNIQDPFLRNFIDTFPQSVRCGCFDHNPAWDGHRMNPPCEIIQLGMDLMEEARKTGEELRRMREDNER